MLVTDSTKQVLDLTVSLADNPVMGELCSQVE